MKFRRKLNDGLNIEAFYWDGSRKSYEQEAPDWFRACSSYANGILKIEAGSRMVSQCTHCWIVREQSGVGAYPVNVLTFESIYSPIL
jgi:hypothetical protein